MGPAYAHGEEEDRCMPGSLTERSLMASGLEDLSRHHIWPSDYKSLYYYTIATIFNNPHFSEEGHLLMLIFCGYFKSRKKILSLLSLLNSRKAAEK